ncbi:MAG: SDR family NAD(P)-dependent oxidoreductase, partial [Flavobacteriales bacterium]
MKKTTNPNEIDFREKFSLKGKVIIISGACGLIGRAFCEAAAQFGAHIVCADIPLSQPENFAQELQEKHGRNMLGVGLDVTQKAEIEKLKNITLEKFGRIDGLVCGHQNKSHLKFEPFENVSEENWDTVVEVNLKCTFLLCQVIGSYMAEHCNGSVVNLPSTYIVV